MNAFAPCPVCQRQLRRAQREGSILYACEVEHRWTPQEFAAAHALALTPPEDENFFLSGDGAWMVRPPRGTDVSGWILNLTGFSNADDYWLLNHEGSPLRQVFETPAAAARTLAQAHAQQVRVHQVWQRQTDDKRVVITQIDRGGLGADGTIFVRYLDDPEHGFSPGDFRRYFSKLAENERVLALPL